MAAIVGQPALLDRLVKAGADLGPSHHLAIARTCHLDRRTVRNYMRPGCPVRELVDLEIARRRADPAGHLSEALAEARMLVERLAAMTQSAPAGAPQAKVEGS